MRFEAPVVRGHGRGKDLVGFPTFNLVIPEDFQKEFGVYAAWVWIGEKRYQGALHYGPIPTFADAVPSLEIYVLDYDSNEPVESLGFEIKKFLRPIALFDSVEALHNQITEDVKNTRTALDG